jgi:serine O-acetyltransferase
MSEGMKRVAEELRAQREKPDPVSDARSQVLPYTRRVGDALGALRALATDDTPTPQLESDLQVVHGLVAALIGPLRATQLMERLPEIRRCIALDVEAAFRGDPSASGYAEIVAAYPSMFAVATYRIAHAFYCLDERLVARIMSEEAHSRTGIDIHPGATIGCHFFIDHGTGVVIGETCRIGDRVKLYHGVTLGAFSNKEGRRDVGRKRHPTICDDVTIYPNATILGGDTEVGEGSVVGGNVWLTESVPRYTRVNIESPHLQIQQKRTPELGDGI